MKVVLAFSLGSLAIAGVLNLALQSSFAEAGLGDSYSTPAASAGVAVSEKPRAGLPTQKPAEPDTPRAISPSPMTSQSTTPRPNPTQTFPADAPKRVIERLLEFPRIQELTDVSNIVVINGEYCVAGELKVVCYNETEDTFNIWDDFDPAPYFDPEWVSPTPAP